MLLDQQSLSVSVFSMCSVFFFEHFLFKAEWTYSSFQKNPPPVSLPKTQGVTDFLFLLWLVSFGDIIALSRSEASFESKLTKFPRMHFPH